MSQADLEISLFPRHAESYGLALRFRHPVAGQDKSASGSFALDAAELRQRQHDPVAYGEQLAAQLFASPGVRSFLDQALAVAASQQTSLHLRLFISADAPDLHSLRWETLRLPGSTAPLAAGEWLRFSRYLDSAGWRPARTVERDALRALVAVASPDVGSTTLAEVRTEDELAAARAGLGDIPSEALASRGQVTLANLLARLRDGCDILYLVAHGMLVDGEPQILLEREDGGRAWTSGRELAARIGELAQPPGLVLLVSCQSAGSGDGESTHDGGALAGLGPRLAAAGVPAVVAMQGNLTMATAAAFMPVFLRELRRDGQVDRAMAVARGAVRERPDWWMPVLYTRLEDGRVFDLTAMLPPPPCPYPGMVPFRAEDSRFFYGREGEIQQMLDHLRQQRLLLVIGPSGSGKSSLIAAGLLPRLEKSSYFAPGFWLVRTMRPLDHPVAALAACLEGDVSQPEQAVAELLAAHAPAQRLLLVIDQFEEAFSLADNTERQQFMAALQALRRSQQCALVIALRADFYPDLMNSDLWPVDPGQRLDVASLRGGALRQAIRQPASDVEVEIDEALIERLLADAAGEPGALPMLQETLVLLWERMRRRQITLGDYERLGEGERSGLAVAVARKADATVAELTPVEQLIAQRTFLRLIQFGEGRRDTRRQLPAADLRSAADDNQAFEWTLEHLARNRLLTLSGEEDDASRRVDIAHEALITGWPLLHKWLNQRRSAEQIRRRLEEKVEEWMAAGKQGGLLDEYELHAAMEWQKSVDASELGMSQSALDLLESSLKAIQQARRIARKRRRLGWTAFAAISLLLIPFVFLATNIWMFYRQQGSAWQPTGFPADAVTHIAVARPQTGTDVPRVCVGSADIGIGCSKDLVTWNIYQIDFPIDRPAWLNNRDTWWGSLTGRVWSTSIRGIDAIAFDLLDSHRVFTVVDQAGLLVSQDAGATWTVISEPSYDNEISPVDRVKRLGVVGNHVFLLRSSGSLVDLEPDQRGSLHVSNDGGHTWQQIGGSGTPTGMIRDFVLVEQNSSESYNLYAIAVEGIFATSPDRNWQWQNLHDFDGEEPLLLDVDNQGQLYSAVYDRATRKTTLSLWDPSQTSAPAWLTEIRGVAKALAVPPNGINDQSIWVLLEDGGIVSVNDRGEQAAHRGRPGWGWAKSFDLVFIDTDDGAARLLMGHRDGVLCYQDNSEMEVLPCGL